MAKIIGIDLGTTNSLVTCFIDDKPIIIPNAFGDNLTPSVVSVLENREIVVGKAAKERLITYPEFPVGSFKRFMGSKKIFNLGVFNLGVFNFNAVELSSFVIKSLKQDAEEFLKVEVTEAIISVPAYFNDNQRKATKMAAKLSGLKVERLINEPTAAAIAYGIVDEDEEKKIMILI